MKVKVPQQIKIGGHYVSVFYEEKLCDNHGKWGQARFPECEIALENRDLTDSAKTYTLLHELIHWIDRVYNNTCLDENTTDALASGIHTLLVDLGIELDFSQIKTKA